jgi:hypothetical protein
MPFGVPQKHGTRLIHEWHNLWPSKLFLDDTKHKPDFTGFRVSTVAKLMNCAKRLSCPEAQLLDTEAVEECLNIDNDAPVALQLKDSEICNIVINENSNDDSDKDQQNVTVEGKISIDRMISLTEKLICGMEQRSFISEQQIMSVYKIKEQFAKGKT